MIVVMRSPRTTAPIALAAIALLLGTVSGCGTEHSVNAPDYDRLSGASNQIVNSSAWNVDQSSIEERWDEDPTVMEPDYPLMNPMPGFANQGVTPYNQ